MVAGEVALGLNSIDDTVNVGGDDEGERLGQALEVLRGPCSSAFNVKPIEKTQMTTPNISASCCFHGVAPIR